MPNEFDPLIGQWYVHTGKGQRFHVAGLDEDTGVVEIQHFAGDVEEFTLEDWRALDIELSEEPENWSGALDVAEQDDLGTGITDTDSADWAEPGEDFRLAGAEKLTCEPDVESDDYGEGYIAEEPLDKSME